MRLPELCLALLCAAAAGTGSPEAAREQSPGPGAAAGRASEAGRGAPGPAAPGTGGVDPRQTWMLLAGSPGRASGSRARGRTGAAAAPAGAPAVLEPLLRELQLLLKGMVKEKAKTCRKAWEGREEEEESGGGNAQARSHCRVEAAFHCWTHENISIKQRARQELQLYYIPEREGMFHHGLGLNLTSRQYTAPVAGYYTFTATLHIGEPSGTPIGEVRNLETVSQLESGGDLFTISITGVLYLQAGQYASVFVDNAAGSPLTIQSGSDFSTILLGV